MARRNPLDRRCRSVPGAEARPTGTRGQVR
ncbi:hypothetical protein PLANTIT3_60674 [Plantibacter sp. T3]|nr:hypothetical protein PLANTIT3_60674 [Plantibacter sp. T3]